MLKHKDVNEHPDCEYCRLNAYHSKSGDIFDEVMCFVFSFPIFFSFVPPLSIMFCLYARRDGFPTFSVLLFLCLLLIILVFVEVSEKSMKEKHHAQLSSR